MVNPYKLLCWLCGTYESAVTDLKGLRWCARCWEKTGSRQEILRSPVGRDEPEQEDLPTDALSPEDLQQEGS